MTDTVPTRPRRAIIALLISLCIATFALSGCIGGGEPVFRHHYTLGASNPAHPQPTTTSRSHGDRVLQIARIDTPPWLAGTAMYYRLAYRNDSRLAAYAYSDWAAPPAALLRRVIRTTLAQDGGPWSAVTGPDNPARTDLLLHLRLNDFSQIFLQPRQSIGVIDLTATLIDNHDKQVRVQRDFRVKVDASAPDAPGGVEALRRASHKLASQLNRWALAALTPTH